MTDALFVLLWGLVAWLVIQVIATVVRLYRVWKDWRP